MLGIDNGTQIQTTAPIRLTGFGVQEFGFRGCEAN